MILSQLANTQNVPLRSSCNPVNNRIAIFAASSSSPSREVDTMNKWLAGDFLFASDFASDNPP